MVAVGSGLLGIALIGSAASVGSSSGHLDATGSLSILAYIAFGCVIVFFVCYIRQLRFPLAKVATVGTPVDQPPPPPKQKYLPPSPSGAELDKDLQELAKSRERQSDSDG